MKFYVCWLAALCCLVCTPVFAGNVIGVSKSVRAPVVTVGEITVSDDTVAPGDTVDYSIAITSDQATRPGVIIFLIMDEKDRVVDQTLLPYVKIDANKPFVASRQMKISKAYRDGSYTIRASTYGSNFNFWKIKQNAFRVSRIVDAACGISNGGAFVVAPTTNLCAAGEASAVTTQGSDFLWTCKNEPGLAASCKATKPVPIDSVCGSANGTIRMTMPTAEAELCAVGKPSAIINDQADAFRWTCISPNGGLSRDCAAAKPLPVTYSWSAGAFGAYGACNGGQQTRTRSVQCMGSDNSVGADRQCGAGKPAAEDSRSCAMPIEGQCGPTSGTTPGSYTCAAGQLSNLVVSPSAATWTCTGQNGGADKNCTAPIANYTWKYGEFGTFGTCVSERRTKTREVWCEATGGSRANDSLCANSGTKPDSIYIEACNDGVELPIIPSNFDIEGQLQPSWGSGDIPASGDIEGAFRFLCAPSHNAYDDPIVYPGQPGKAHLHTFFGNTMADAYSTYASLRTTGNSSCNNLLNRSAYWMPAMMHPSGKVVMPDYVSIYYKRSVAQSKDCGPPVSGGCRDLPRGLRYVFGAHMSDPAKSDPAIFRWFNCYGTPNAISGHFGSIREAAAGCPAGASIGALIVGPNCWNGKDLDSPDHRSHMAYQSYGYWGFAKCPETHPYLLPFFELAAWYMNDGTAAQWKLSSDVMMGTEGGATFHADWFGAWDSTIQERWTANCIDKGQSCSGGDLGNGTQLKNTAKYIWSDYAKPVLVDPPAAPGTTIMPAGHDMMAMPAGHMM